MILFARNDARFELSYSRELPCGPSMTDCPETSAEVSGRFLVI